MPSDAFKIKADSLYKFLVLTLSRREQVMPDDHSDVVPLLPIPNRTVKRVSADDSADCPCESRSSSGFYSLKKPNSKELGFLFLLITSCLKRDRLCAQHQKQPIVERWMKSKWKYQHRFGGASAVDKVFEWPKPRNHSRAATEIPSV